MYCPKCGSQCSDDEKYCNQCGALLQREAEAGLETPVQYQGQAQKQVQGGTVYIVLGWIFFGLSFLVVPVLFGAGTVIMGYLVKKSGRDTHGTVMMILGVAGAILGGLIGFIVGAISASGGF